MVSDACPHGLGYKECRRQMEGLLCPAEKGILLTYRHVSGSCCHLSELCDIAQCV